VNSVYFCTDYCTTLFVDVMSHSYTCERLKEVMDQVVDDHQPVVISRRKAESVVMVSLADWHAIEETVHLPSSPANAARLKSSIDELSAGGGTEHQQIET
jgi:antitoxin YefM